VRLLQPFNCKIIACDVKDYADFYRQWNVEPVSHDELLARSDVLTLHLARPQLQAVPPFRPMAIQHANIIAVDDGQPEVSSSAFCDQDRGSSVPRPTAIWRDGQGFLRMDDAFGISAHHVKDYTAVRRASHG